MEKLGIICIALGVLLFWCSFLGLWKPQWFRSATRGKAFGKVMGTAITLFVIGGMITDPPPQASATQTQATTEETESVKPVLLNSRAIAQESPLLGIETETTQLPDLTHSELSRYLSESSTAIGDLTLELLNRYKASKRSSDYHGFNRWRVNEWAPQVSKLSEQYELVVEQHGRQLRLSDMAPVFWAPKDLSLASLNLIWRPGKDGNHDLFKQRITAIGDGYKKAEKYLADLSTPQ